MAKQNLRWPDNISDSERISAAKLCVGKVLDHALYVLRVHESNRLLVFSDLIEKQIQPSFGAHTFNILRDSQYKYEIVRLYALWDRESSDRESILTIIKLIDKASIIEALEIETKNEWLSIGSHIVDLEKHDPETQKWIEEETERSLLEIAIDRAHLAGRSIQAAIYASKRIAKSERLKALRHVRDVYAAHALDPSKISKPQQSMRHGDEKWLMNYSIMIINWLNVGVRGASMDWEASRKMAQRNASYFWEGVTVSVQK